MPCAVILTALPVEYLAVRAHLSDLQEEMHPQETIYERGRFAAAGQVWGVGIVEIGPGNVGAALEAERAIAYFNPDIILFVGVAGGIKDVAIGDVVASTKVYGYESGKAEQRFKPRPEIGWSAYNLEQRARAEARKEDWLKRLAVVPERTPCVIVGPIAAGEKVVASTESDVFQFLREHYGDAIAVEMEGLGFLEAARANQRVSAMVVRGISDQINYKTEADQGGSQDVAARHASAFAFELIASTTLERVDRRGVRTKRNSKELFVLPKVDVPTFTGRLEELRQLEAQLLDADGEKACSIVGLSGRGGMGKSALAFHFATLYRDRFPDGVIGLPVDGKTPHEIARDFARLCGTEIDEEDDRLATTIMQEVFAHRRMLLIFDNADHADLKDLRPGGQTCALIVTTRDRTVPDSFGIPRNGIIDLPPLPQDDARQLLCQILGAERVMAEQVAVDRIIEMTGGLPLALQIVGSALRGRQRSLASYVESLAEEKTRLQRLQIRGDSDLNVTVSLNLSLKLLDDAEVDLFACLSVCAKDGFSLQTAMVAGGVVDEWEAQKLLDWLYQLSLLNEVSQDRYVFHALVRVYAQECAKERNLWENAAQRHVEYFLKLVNSNDVESPEIAKHIEADFNDILQSAQWLRTNAVSDEQKEAAYQLALDLRPFLLKGYSTQAVELMTGFQVWAEQLNDWNASVKFKIQHAKYLALDGRLQAAETILRDAQDLIDRISDPTQQQENQAKQLSSLGGVLQKQGKFEEAIAAFQRQITIEETLNDQKSLAITLNRLGGLLEQQGRVDEAITAFERRITISEALNDQRQSAIGFNRLGRLFQQQERFEEAINAFQRQISISQFLNDKNNYHIGMRFLVELLNNLSQEGKLNKVLFTFKNRMNISESLGDREQLSIALFSLGKLLQKEMRFDEAINVFQRQIAISRSLNDKKQSSIGLGFLVKLLNDLSHQSKLNEVIVTLQSRVSLNEAFDDQHCLTIELNHLSKLLEKKGKLDEAVNALQFSISIIENSSDLNDLNNQRQLVITLNCLGNLLRKQNKYEEAIATFEYQITIAETLSDQKRLTIGLNCLGELLQQQGRFNDAIAAFERRITITETLNDQKELAIGLNRLGRLLQQHGRFNDALNTYQRQISVSQFLHDKNSYHFGMSCLVKLLNYLSQKGNLNEVLFVFENRMNINNLLDDQKQFSIALFSLGKLLQQERRFDEAINVFQRQIVISRSLNDKKQSSIGMSFLVKLLHDLSQQGELDEVITTLQTRISLGKLFDDQRSLTTGLNRLSRVLQKQGKIDEAINALQLSISIIENSRELNDQRQLAIILNQLGSLLGQQNKCEKIIANSDNQITISEQISEPFHSAVVLHNLGRVLKVMNRLEEAEKVLQQSRDQFTDLKNNQQLLRVLNTLGGVLERRRDWKGSERVLRESYDLACKEQDVLSQAIISTSLGQLFSKQPGEDNFSTARMYFVNSIKLGETAGSPAHLAKAYTAWGKALIDYKKLEDAVVYLSQGFAIDESLGNVKGLKFVTRKLAEALVKLGRQAEVLDYCDRAILSTGNHPSLIRLRDTLCR
jgi:tetratricopeptide (TPR) repeat protein/nucleoside phosphorylase